MPDEVKHSVGGFLASGLQQLERVVHGPRARQEVRLFVSSYCKQIVEIMTGLAIKSAQEQAHADPTFKRRAFVLHPILAPKEVLLSV